MLVAQIVFPQPSGMPGGTQTHVMQLIADLSRNEGIHSAVVSGRSAQFTKQISHLVDIYELFDDRERLSLSRMNRAIEWVKSLRPSVIHSHGYEANWFSLLVRRAQSTTSSRVAWIATIHGWLENSYKEQIKAWLDRMSLFWADGVIAVAPGQIERCWLRKGNLWTIIPNGVDVEYYAALSRANELRQRARFEWQIPAGALVIGTAGRMSPEKAYDVFCGVASYIAKFNQNTWFVVAGDGAERVTVERYVRLFGLESRFSLVGTLEDMRGFYSSLDLFLLTSRVEGTPRVLLEAMASGIPVVSTDVGGVRILIPSQLCQYLLAPANSVEALANRVRHLLEDQALRLELGETLAKHVAENFASRKMARQISRFYSKVMENL